MTWIIVRAAGLTCVYLLVLTSVAPGDVLLGALLALAVAITVHPARVTASRSSPGQRLRGTIVMVISTAWEMALGSWRVVRFCLGGDFTPGLVEIPRQGRSDRAVALWGVLTGEAPDEVPVDVDETRDVLIVHLIDAADPDAVRRRHERARDGWLRHVVS